LPPAVPLPPADASPEKSERVWLVTWAAIIVGSGGALLLLWALVFRGGSAPQPVSQEAAEQTSWKDYPLAEQIEAGGPPIGVSPEMFEKSKNEAKERFEKLPGVTEHKRTFEQLILDWVADHQGQPLPEQQVMSGWIQEMRAELRRELVASPEVQTVLARMKQLEEPEGPEFAALQHEFERLARIEAEANASDSADDATVAAVERRLAPRSRPIGSTQIPYGPGEIGSVMVPADSPRARSRYWVEDIEDDFAGGTSGIDGAACTMTWRSHHAELISRLKEDGYETCAAHLARLADVNSLKKPFTAADEANVIKSILEYLAAFKEEVSGDGTPSDPAPESQTPAAKPSDAAGVEAVSESNGGKPDDDSPNRYDKLDELTPSVRKAYWSFLCAEAECERRLEDREAYDWLRENGIDASKEDAGELEGYELPDEFDTWSRYLRGARKAIGEQKYTPRRGRPTGGSMVRRDQIEPQKPTDD